MASLFKKLMPKKGGASQVEAHVAAFGKHPGWDDHIEDLGLDTYRLVAIKRVLYTVGIAGNIDSGAWEKLGETERLDGFRHLILWHTPQSIIVGRMWSSSDGKGRTRYPMVVCAQMSGLTLEWALRHAVPLLGTIEARCRKATSAAVVRAVVQDAVQVLRQASQGVEPTAEPLPAVPGVLAYLADRSEMEPGHQGIHRILYQIEREMAAYHATGGESSVSSTALMRASHMRVPRCAGTPQVAAVLWLSFLVGRLDPAAPMLFILPLKEPWVDVIVGEPGVQQFFCVRASLQAVPMATEIPYTIDPAFVGNVETAIEKSREESAPLPRFILEAAALPREKTEVFTLPKPEAPAPQEKAAPAVAAGPAPVAPSPPAAAPPSAPSAPVEPAHAAGPAAPPEPQRARASGEPAAAEAAPPEAAPTPAAAAPRAPSHAAEPRAEAAAAPKEPRVSTEMAARTELPPAPAGPEQPRPVREAAARVERPPAAAIQGGPHAAAKAPTTPEMAPRIERAEPREARTEPGVAGRPVAAPEERAKAAAPAAKAKPAAKPINEMETVLNAEAAASRAEPAEAAWGWAAEPRPSIGQRLLRLWPVYLILIVLAILAFLFLPLLLYPTGSPPKKSDETAEFAWRSEVEGKAWQDLCKAYQDWLPAFYQKLTKERLEAWKADEGLAELIVKPVVKAKYQSVNPRDIAGMAGGDLEYLGANPPKSVKSREGADRIKQALEIVKGIEESVSRWAEYDDGSLMPLSRTFATRGWAKQAAELEAAASTLKRDPNLAEAIDAALTVKQKARTIEDAAQKVLEAGKAMSILDDGLPKQIDELLKARTQGTETLGVLQAKVDEVLADASKVAADSKLLTGFQDTLQKAGGPEVVKAFAAAVRASVGPVSDLGKAAEKLAAVRPIVRKADQDAKEVMAQREKLGALDGKELAEKLGGLVRAGLLSAGKLDEFAQRLAAAAAAAAKLVERCNGLQKQAAALTPLGAGFLQRFRKSRQDAADKAATPEELAAALDDAKALGDKIASNWAALQPLAKTLEGAGDDLLRSFPQFLQAQVDACKDPAALPDRLEALRGKAAAVAAIVQGDWKAGKIDRELFKKESAVHREVKMADATLDAWLKEVGDYCKVDKPDPRQEKAWAADVEDFRYGIQLLKEEADPAKRQAAEKCQADCDRLEADRNAIKSLPWVRKNEKEIAGRAEAINGAIKELKDSSLKEAERAERWLPRVRATDPLTSSRVVNEEWAKRRDQLVPPKWTVSDVNRDRNVYVALRRDVKAVRDFLSQLDDAKALPAGLQDLLPGVPDTLLAPVRQALAARREATLQKAIAAIPTTDRGVPTVAAAEFKKADAWDRAAKGYDAWRTDAAAFVRDAGTIQTLLDAGYCLDDKSNEAPAPLRELHGAWQKTKVAQELAPHFRAVSERVQMLLDLERLDRKHLVERAAKGLGKDEPPQVPLTLWRKLGEVKDWPADAAELKQELALEGALRRLAGVSPQAVRSLAQELAKEGPRRWEVCFHAVTSQSDPKELMALPVIEVADLLKSFGDVDKVLSGLRPDTRFRWKLYHLRRQASGFDDKVPKTTLNAAIGDFVATVNTLGDLARQPQVRSLLEGLDKVAKQEAPKDNTVGLDKAGPAGGPLGDKWQPQLGAEGKSVTYMWQGGKTRHSLTFARVEPKDQGKAFYLCITETPVGVVLETVDAAQKGADMALLLGKPPGRTADTREGPCTWEWKRGGAEEMVRARAWLFAEAASTFPLYPEGLNAGKPQDQQPVQYVSAPAALELAWLLGCRLQSAGEWKAAFEVFEKGKTDPKRNLRDATWRRQQEFTIERGKRGPVSYPDADVFPLPNTPPGEKVKRGDKAAAATDANDGALWFTTVGAGSAPQHLVGNVAELILDDPAAFEDGILKASQPPTAGSFRDFVRKHDKAFAVIGASALSPPEVWDGQEHPFDTAVPLTFTRDGLDSFSDVGFRLAFTAPVETPADLLKRTLKSCGYPATK